MARDDGTNELPLTGCRTKAEATAIAWERVAESTEQKRNRHG